MHRQADKFACWVPNGRSSHRAQSSFEDLVQYNDGFKANLNAPQQIAQRIMELKAARGGYWRAFCRFRKGWTVAASAYGHRCASCKPWSGSRTRTPSDGGNAGAGVMAGTNHDGCCTVPGGAMT